MQVAVASPDEERVPGTVDGRRQGSTMDVVSTAVMPARSAAQVAMYQKRACPSLSGPSTSKKPRIAAITAIRQASSVLRDRSRFQASGSGRSGFWWEVPVMSGPCVSFTEAVVTSAGADVAVAFDLGDDVGEVECAHPLQCGVGSEFVPLLRMPQIVVQRVVARSGVDAQEAGRDGPQLLPVEAESGYPVLLAILGSVCRLRDGE